MKPKTTTAQPSVKKTPRARKIKQKFPKGWNEKKVCELIAECEKQTDDEIAAEIDAAKEAEAQGQTLMAIPTELVPVVREIIARYRPSA